MGAVTLLVGDLDAMTRYYRDVVTLEVLDRRRHRRTRPRGPPHRDPAPRARAAPCDARLGRPVPHRDPVRDQTALAAALYSVARHAPGTFTGSADHLVSQAFYFTDPEGNGIELYWDRDRTTWSWTHGQIEMATLSLDPNAFLGEHLTEEPALGATAARRGIRRARASLGRRCRRPHARSTSTRSASTRPRRSAPGAVRRAPAATTITWR